MSLSRSGIEYLTHSWPVFSGCLHTQAECPTADKCWARTMAHRFHRSFEPAFHSKALYGWHTDHIPFPRQPAHIGVSFTGDMFGNFNFTQFNKEWTEGFIRRTLEVVALNPQHRFYFLTKAPQNLARFNPWPSNAWVGMSLCGIGLGESYKQEAERIDAFEHVEGGHRWLSYEPILNSLWYALPEKLEWLVLGAQGGPGAELPCREIVEQVEAEANERGIPVWRKNNLVKVLGMEPRQERLE